LPARKVTMPTFGGADLKTLFVTTATDEGAEGGDLYAMHTDVAGLAPVLFDPDI
jgi:sugar lactone lactonase YvrE